MRLGKDLVGKTIISITDGRSLGEVKDIYLDSQLTTITGIYLGSEGLLKRKHFLIARKSVVVFGIDAILVEKTDVTLEEEDRPEAAAWVRLSKLRGRDVDTPGGTKVASIGDVILGEQGDITGFALSRVYVEGPIAQNGRIPRSALIDTGGEDQVMTIDLTKAENPETAADEETEAPEPATLAAEPTPAAETQVDETEDASQFEEDTGAAGTEDEKTTEE